MKMNTFNKDTETIDGSISNLSYVSVWLKNSLSSWTLDCLKKHNSINERIQTELL